MEDIDNIIEEMEQLLNMPIGSTMDIIEFGLPLEEYLYPVPESGLEDGI